MSRLAIIAVVLAAACNRQPQRDAATPAPRQLHIATAADSAFVRRICYAPDSVLAGAKPCYDREQKSNIKVF